MLIPNNHNAILKAPATTGIYIYKGNKGEILYVGKAVSIKARLLSHEQNAKIDAKEALIIKSATKIKLIPVQSEFEALLLEASTISRLRPKFNVRWKDDKSNLYIKITTGEMYPKVLLTRKEDDGLSRYFGPFSSVHSAESLLRALRKIVPFCTQNKLGSSKCFYSKIGLCNPCPNSIYKISDKALQRKLRAKYKTNIKLLCNVLTGQTSKIKKELLREITMLSNNNRFEDAIAYRDTLNKLDFLIRYGKLGDANQHDYNKEIQRSTRELKQLLVDFFPQLSKLDRIEIYDNSTLGFTHQTASMVVFENGRNNKQEYRRFKLDAKTISDFDMMKEVITRRLTNDWKKPDLIVVDGGKPQVKVAMSVLNSQKQHIPIIGIAKNPDRLIIGVVDLPTIKPLSTNLGFRLIQRGRDEAHRFAKKYHIYLRSKTAVIQ
jgi:excinuclease ABC subunit C